MNDKGSADAQDNMTETRSLLDFKTIAEGNMMFASKLLKAKISEKTYYISHTSHIDNSTKIISMHPMVTRAKAIIFKPLERMNCHVTTTSPLPRSHVHALQDPD
ncbi:hypothetical protein Tco_1159279 [Tanacetum coccineum]